jgi:hypothetical protein
VDSGFGTLPMVVLGAGGGATEPDVEAEAVLVETAEGKSGLDEGESAAGGVAAIIGDGTSGLKAEELEAPLEDAGAGFLGGTGSSSLALSSDRPLRSSRLIFCS